MLVYIGKPLLSTFRWVPTCQSFNHFSICLHHFALAKWTASSIRVNMGEKVTINEFQIFQFLHQYRSLLCFFAVVFLELVLFAEDHLDLICGDVRIALHQLDVNATWCATPGTVLQRQNIYYLTYTCLALLQLEWTHRLTFTYSGLKKKLFVSCNPTLISFYPKNPYP